MIPHHWKRAAADNGSADPNLDVRPNRSANTLLGSIRGLMASGAAARDDAIGELVAGLGGSKTNVYSVATNEGLIDIATGINGVPAAITSPFLLRLSFDTTLTGSGTNAPHLTIDGFDCGPILRRDGSALADGDLVKGVPVLVIGDMAQSTDTKVTRVRVLDLTPSDLQIGPVGQCRLVFTNANTVTLLPIGAGRLVVNGSLVTVPAGGVTLNSGGLLAVDPTTLGPLYYVYAYVGASGLTLEASTTGHVTGANGVEVKSGDATRTLVGMVVLDGTAGTQGTFADTVTKRYVASYFSRQPKIMRSPIASASTASTTAVELSTSLRLPFLTWGDEFVRMVAQGTSYSSADSAYLYLLAGIDGSPDPNIQVLMQAAGVGPGTYAANAALENENIFSEGYHYFTPMARVGSATAFYTLSSIASVRA